MFLLGYIYFFVITVWFSFGIRYWTADDPQLEWTRHLNWAMGIRLHKKHGSPPINDDGPTILLGNHRGVADISIHDVITEGSASFLGRYIVAFMLPAIWFMTRWVNTVWYFKRGGNANSMDKFYAWLDKNFEWPYNMRKNLIVFPEGHRNDTNRPLPVRSGMLQYAWARKYKVQIYIVKGSENVMDERAISCDFAHHDLHYLVDKPIDPLYYRSADEFVEHVKKRYESKFYEIYNA